MAPYVSVVIPIYNEEANIEQLWARLSKVLKESFDGKGWEVVMTDDGSRDKSLEMILEKLSEC